MSKTEIIIEPGRQAIIMKRVFDAPERCIQTFEFDGMPGHVALETLTLVNVDGKTLYTAASAYQSVEDRDGMAQSMEPGASESLDRLPELLQTLQ